MPESSLTWMGRQRAKGVYMRIPRAVPGAPSTCHSPAEAFFLPPHPGLSPSINNRTNVCLEEPQQDENARRATHLPRPHRHVCAVGHRPCRALGLVIFLGADFRACWHLWQQYGTTLGNLDIACARRTVRQVILFTLHTVIIASSCSALLGLQMSNRLCICSLQVDITALVPFFQCLSRLRLIIGVRLEYYDEAAGKNF